MNRYAVFIPYCCNLTDHIGLPIIHIETYNHNRHKRHNGKENNSCINKSHEGPYIHKIEPNSHVAQQPNIYDCKRLQVTTCRFSQLT